MWSKSVGMVADVFFAVGVGFDMVYGGELLCIHDFSPSCGFIILV